MAGVYKVIVYECKDIKVPDSKAKRQKEDKVKGADPYATIRWNGHEVGMTKVQPKTANPYFGNESFVFDPKDPNYELEEGAQKEERGLLIEIWDKDEKSDSFLGQIPNATFEILDVGQITKPLRRKNMGSDKKVSHSRCGCYHRLAQEFDRLCIEQEV